LIVDQSNACVPRSISSLHGVARPVTLSAPDVTRAASWGFPRCGAWLYSLLMFDQEPVNASRQVAPAPSETSRDQTVELFNIEGGAPVLVLCDHAGRWVPPELADLGLPESELARHIGWDIGSADVARRLARLLDAPGVLCHVSRLVVDPNRKPGDPSSMPKVSDGSVVPGNQDLGPEQVRWRLARFFLPYHRAVARQIARLRRRQGVPVIISVHSFTPQLADARRPWDVAVLWDTDARLAARVLEALRRDPDLHVGDNEPYSGRFPVGYSIPFHAARSRLPHVTFEVRQDLIATREAGEAWAERLAGVLREPLSDRKLYALNRS
jgi:predicted N-formylglutamate amidohydrolase